MKNLKMEREKNKKISIIALTSMVWILILSCLVFINEYAGIKTISIDFIKQKTYVPVAKKDINFGDIITKDDIFVKEVTIDNYVNGRIRNVNEILGKKATHDIYRNEIITKSDFADVDIIDKEMVDFTLPVNLSVLHNKNIRVNDYVDVYIDYKDKDNKEIKRENGKIERFSVNKKSEIVVAKVKVTSIMDAKGNFIYFQEIANDNVPAFVNVLVEKKYVENLLDAKKRGTINLVKYLDVNKPASVVNYKPSWE